MLLRQKTSHIHCVTQLPNFDPKAAPGQPWNTNLTEFVSLRGCPGATFG